MFYFISTIVFCLYWTIIGKINQKENYHYFAGDHIHHLYPVNNQPKYYHYIERDFNHQCCIPNFANVISNIPFALVGIYGLLYGQNNSIGWLGFNIASIGVFLGSSYYHWNPNNSTLVWDRIPMTLCTTSITYEIFRLYDFPLHPNDLNLWWVVGIYSVIYWNLTGDLRLYAFVQYYPILFIILLMIFDEDPYNLNKSTLAISIGVYVFARICEYFDHTLYRYTPLSGHVWKHLLCAYAMYILI